jgi:hypothetical protein
MSLSWSQASSSRSVISWITPALRVMLSGTGEFARGASLASDNDNPAAPKTGTAFLLRFRFEVCSVRDTQNFPEVRGAGE